MLIRRPIGVTEIVQIAALSDSVLRNLWITTAYHDLARGLARLVGSVNVSWPAFATWASKTAGASIRGEVLPARIRAALDKPGRPYHRAVEMARSRLDKHVLDVDADIFSVVDEAVAAVSRQIAAGNLLVFQELGPIFAGLVAAFAGPAAPDAAQRAAFINSVKAVDDDTAATARLRVVIERYCDAMAEPDAVRKADQILLANGLAGLTEQIRLQPNIQGALDAPIETSLGEWVDRTLARIPAAARFAAKPALELMVREIADVWRRIATELLMELGTPSGDFDLGEDVPAPAGRPLFPADLQQIVDPPLVALLEQYDRTGGTGVRSGADDWADLDQRMNFILNLFRSRQQDDTLLLPPFTDEQWAEMEGGHVPAGGL